MEVLDTYISNKNRMAKKMKGLMCHSPSSTAVCMTGDHQSVVEPRRPNNGTNYIRLGKQRAIPATLRRSSPHVSSLMKGQEKKKPREATATSLALPDHVFQVVVMRVSLHCQACAGKVRKHLSKMEGVTSFSIELESKKVTVMGHVSPSAVLESISKVKRADYWACN